MGVSPAAARCRGEEDALADIARTRPNRPNTLDRVDIPGETPEAPSHTLLITERFAEGRLRDKADQDQNWRDDVDDVV